MTVTSVAATPYDSARALFGSGIPNWLNAFDAARLASYTLYENIYWNHPETFKLVMRGTNDLPIYIPSAKIVCNTLNRYVAKGYEVVVDPDQGSSQQQDAIAAWYKYWLKTQRFYSRFKTNRLYGIIRGDSMWYITANAEKPEGSRVTVSPIDPGSVFWIMDDDEENKTGVDIVQQLVADDGKTLYVRRQRYLRSTHPEHPAYTEDAFGNPTTYDGEITYQMDSFQVADWEDPTKRKNFTEGASVPQTIIPGITRLPVYGYPNQDEPESVYGASELKGYETLITGVNQSASDEDLSLALAGLGQYWTDSGPPVDENDEETTWGLGPGEVIEVGTGKVFNRLAGITSIAPFQDHMKFLQEQMFRTTGASDVAQGQVEATIAESGIALTIRMGPILDASGDKDTLIVDAMDQMLFDLRQWFEVYEGQDFGQFDPLNPGAAAVVVSKMGEKLPENKDQRFKDLMAGYNAIPAIFSGSFVRQELRRMGWKMPDDNEVMNEIADEAAFFTDATAVDPQAARLAQEAAGGNPTAPTPPAA
jgi:hypothetical protein